MHAYRRLLPSRRGSPQIRSWRKSGVQKQHWPGLPHRARRKAVWDFLDSYSYPPIKETDVHSTFTFAAPAPRNIEPARPPHDSICSMSTTFSSTMTAVAATAAIVTRLLAAKLPITDLRDDSTTNAIIGSGRTKLSTTWLRIMTVVALKHSAMPKAGTMVIRRRTHTGMLRPVKPCMITWPAIVPTTELEMPDAINETRNTPAAPMPSAGIKV